MESWFLNLRYFIHQFLVEVVLEFEVLNVPRHSVTFKDIDREKASLNKTQNLTKSMNMCI